MILCANRDLGRLISQLDRPLWFAVWYERLVSAFRRFILLRVTWGFAVLPWTKRFYESPLCGVEVTRPYHKTSQVLCAQNRSGSTRQMVDCSSLAVFCVLWHDLASCVIVRQVRMTCLTYLGDATRHQPPQRPYSSRQAVVCSQSVVKCFTSSFFSSHAWLRTGSSAHQNALGWPSCWPSLASICQSGRGLGAARGLGSPLAITPVTEWPRRCPVLISAVPADAAVSGTAALGARGGGARLTVDLRHRPPPG